MLPDETTRAIPGRGFTLALLAAVFAVHFLDRQVLAILIPPIKSEFGLSDTALGLLSGFAFTLLFSTVGLLIARLADVVSRAHVIVASLIAFSAMTVACGFASNYWQLFVWTEPVKAFAQRKDLKDAKRNILVTGVASSRAREGLRATGWAVQENSKR